MAPVILDKGRADPIKERGTVSCQHSMKLVLILAIALLAIAAAKPHRGDSSSDSKEDPHKGRVSTFPCIRFPFN